MSQIAKTPQRFKRPSFRQILMLNNLTRWINPARGMHVIARLGGAAMFKKITVVAFSLAAVWLLTTPAAFADDWDKLTRFTVNQPFQIPGGITLPAGTYLVKIVDLVADRYVVRFMSEDGLTIYSTTLAFPNFRPEPTDKTEMTFGEAEPNEARQIQTWFYPGRQFGVEFAYPERRPAEFPAFAAEPEAPFKDSAPVYREKPAEPVEEFVEEPIVAVAEPEEEAKPVEYPEFVPVEEPELGLEYAEPLPLPKTATPFPAIGLIGLVAAGIASSLRLLNKK
jgi:hypothetical protein